MAARQRAGAARAAFGKVGQAPVPDGVDASITASDNAGMDISVREVPIASDTDVSTAGAKAARKPRATAGSKARRKSRTKASDVASEPTRRGVRPGRPAGPARVPLSVRILAETDARLIAAIGQTGDTPQNIVERALLAELDRLGIGTAE